MNKHYRATFISNKSNIYIADSFVGKFDTAFAEVEWGYDDSAHVYENNEREGYYFVIALTKLMATNIHLQLQTQLITKARGNQLQL